MFKNNEVYALVISIFLLAFVFAYDDGQPIFAFSYWIFNYLKFVLFVAIVLLSREIFRKLCAQHCDAQSEYGLWILRYFLSYETEGDKGPAIKKIELKMGKRIIHGFPIGVFLSLLLSIGTSGKVFFTGVGSTIYSVNHAQRTGRKHTHLTEWEHAKLALSASFVNFGFIILFTILGNAFDTSFKQFIDVNFWVMFFNLLPLPGLDGGTLFFKSMYLYIFGLVFILLAYFLLSLGVLFSLSISLIVALLALAFFWYKDKKMK